MWRDRPAWVLRRLLGYKAGGDFADPPPALAELHVCSWSGGARLPAPEQGRQSISNAGFTAIVAPPEVRHHSSIGHARMVRHHIHGFHSVPMERHAKVFHTHGADHTLTMHLTYTFKFMLPGHPNKRTRPKVPHRRASISCRSTTRTFRKLDCFGPCRKTNIVQVQPMSGIKSQYLYWFWGPYTNILGYLDPLS